MATTPLASNNSVLSKYLSLDQPEDKVLVTYIWIDGTLETLRCKTRVLNFVPKTINDVPGWFFPGAGTHQAVTVDPFDLTDTDNYMKPAAMYRDPFNKNNNKLVLVEVMDNKGKPHPTNTRSTCVEVMKRVQKEHDPWFGIEQEYVLLEGSAHPHTHPLGWPSNGYPLNSHSAFPSFLAVGTNKVYGRDVVEAHTRACLYAGINISGTNAEGMPGQWEYQVGPSDGVSVADDLWMSRYILHRVAEDFGVGVTFDPKAAGDEFMGSGAHCNVSTLKTRTPGLGINAIEEAMHKLSKKHSEHMKAYDPKQGKDNERRMNGGLLAPKMAEFTWGIANRDASVRIPRPVADEGHGYFEDRRPASNCDPYSVCERIVRTICLDE